MIFPQGRLQCPIVLFGVSPVVDLPSGTEIVNSADIQFEIFEILTTDPVTTIIDDADGSFVVPLVLVSVSGLVCLATTGDPGSPTSIASSAFTLPVAEGVTDLGVIELADRIGSSFDASNEDWSTVNNGTQGANFVATGGDPDGHVCTGDGSSGIGSYESSPLFRGDHSRFYGGRFEFSWRIGVSGSPRGGEELRIAGDGLAFARQLALPGSSFVRVSVALDENGGWTVPGSSTRPSAAQFQRLMGNLTSLRITADNIAGADNTCIDRVDFVLPSP